MVDYSAAGAVATVGTAETLYYVHDALGSVIGLTDAGGTLVERYVYDPYGRTVIERPNGTGGWTLTDGSGEPWRTSAYDNPFLWTGQRYDPGVELYAFVYRTYSPQLGRWLQRDPLGYVDGMNLYEYVRSGPVRYVDPFGLKSCPQCPWWHRVTDWIFAGTDSYAEERDREQAITTTADVVGTAADVASGGLTAAPKAALKRPLRNLAVKAADAAAAGAQAARAGGNANKAAKACKVAKSGGKGTIYEVPGEATPSGKPYVGRHNKPDPAKTRRSPDGRDRSQAKVVDEYDADNPMEGRIKEQNAIDERGGVTELDNKRNEIAPHKRVQR